METLTETVTTGITFAVDDVAPAQTRLKEESLYDSLERRSGRAFVSLPERERRVVANAHFHPLIEAIHRAFADHRPLVLSPDDIWLTIQQGFAHHVNENAESLRDKFVSHKGKRELVVQVESFPTDETWPDAIALWSASVREYIDPQLHAALVCNFSTTTPPIRTASEVALLDAFQRYFDYVMMGVCGIPEITLRGTADDWRKIRQRIDLLEPYDLEWWVPRLRPILDEFVKTTEGNPDRAFWQAIYKPAHAYGGDVATGWITDLFPYFGDNRNWTLEKPRNQWAIERGISVDTFPAGLSCAPITIHPGDIHLNLVAGFLGVTQNTETEALAPLIGWSVCEPDTIDAFWNQCASRFPYSSPLENDDESFRNFLDLPAELVAYRQRFSSMRLFAESRNPWVIELGYSPGAPDDPIRTLSPETIFAHNLNNLALGVELIPIRRSSSFAQCVSLGRLEWTFDDETYKLTLEDKRELEGTVLEVLKRLIAAEGNPSKL
jgi:hypothetical protein